MESQVQTILEPFARQQLFPTAEDAARRLAIDYARKHIQSHQRKIARLEHKYRMSLSEFEKYLQRRSSTLQSPTLKPTLKRKLGREIMNEEEDWLEWKATREMLDSWLRLKAELTQ